MKVNLVPKQDFLILAQEKTSWRGRGFMLLNGSNLGHRSPYFHAVSHLS